VPRTILAASLALLAWCAASAGQAPSPEATPPARACPPLRYLRERAADLLDIFDLNVGAGRGAKLDLRYGVQLFGLADIRTHRAGILDRRVGTWRELDSQLALFPLSYLAYPVEHAARLARWRRLAADAAFVRQAGTLGVQHLDRKELNGDPEFILKDTVAGAIHTRWGDCFPVGAEVHLGVGVRAMVRPLQLVDFLVGFVGLELDPWLTAEPGK